MQLARQSTLAPYYTSLARVIVPVPLHGPCCIPFLFHLLSTLSAIFIRKPRSPFPIFPLFFFALMRLNRSASLSLSTHYTAYSAPLYLWLDNQTNSYRSTSSKVLYYTKGDRVPSSFGMFVENLMRCRVVLFFFVSFCLLLEQFSTFTIQETLSSY